MLDAPNRVCLTRSKTEHQRKQKYALANYALAISLMKPQYIPQNIEAKWQEKWDAEKLYRSTIDPNKEKYYALTMLPYPSGNLHIGHWYAMTPGDARARYMRMQGKNVLFPMGFDAFGLPAENAAIKRNLHPKDWTYDNIANMQKQLRSMGAMFDWEREAISADPKYYTWTEWFFIQLFKNDLAYRDKKAVDWCPNCNTTLAREQVWGPDRVCERCGTPVIKKELEQWFFKITDYADELLKFDGMDWPEQIRAMQTNWIGKSHGASVTFYSELGDPIEVFTTRPDTLWGATFMVLAPEHPLVTDLTTPAQAQAVADYKEAASKQTDIERESTVKEKTGVWTGGYAINPVNDAKIPVWIADYVLMGYGTGAIMAVPAHDQRDFEFARKYDLKVIPVVGAADAEPLDGDTMEEAAIVNGDMINSGELTGTPGADAIPTAIQFLEERNIGKGTVNYRLRDWLISRQRYWGSPIPMIHCKSCGVVPVPEEELPVLLPDDIEWLPSGESPLKLHPTWKYVKCPVCDEDAERDTDTMDTFMCSSWYHLRYLSPDYAQGPVDPEEEQYWMPVDSYTGGAEHATMHLIYTRFFHKAARDMGIVHGDEPMLQLRNQGQILGPDGLRMSKSRGNVVDPDKQVSMYGADTVRAYLMFGYRWKEGGPWSDNNITGVSRWLQRAWNLVHDTVGAEVGKNAAKKARMIERKQHQTIARVSKDMEAFEFNTIVSALMEFTNTLIDASKDAAGSDAFNDAIRDLLLLMAPITPHIAEELWAVIGGGFSVHQQSWPTADAEKAKEDEITLVLQHNGKTRDKVNVPADISKADAEALALENPSIIKFLDGREPKKVIFVPGRLVNVVG